MALHRPTVQLDTQRRGVQVQGDEFAPRRARGRLRGGPCPPFLQAVEGCPVDEETGLPLRASRLREAWIILRTGFSRTVRTASEGIEALSLQKQLYSAAVGTPGLVTAQLLVDKLMPLRLANELEKAFEDSLKDIRIGT